MPRTGGHPTPQTLLTPLRADPAGRTNRSGARYTRSPRSA